MLRSEDPGTGGDEVDVGVVDAAHDLVHLAEQVEVRPLGDRDDVQLLEGNAAEVGRTVIFGDPVPGVSELSVVDLQAVIVNGQHGSSDLSLQGLLIIEISRYALSLAN